MDTEFVPQLGQQDFHEAYSARQHAVVLVKESLLTLPRSHGAAGLGGKKEYQREPAALGQLCPTGLGS